MMPRNPFEGSAARSSLPQAKPEARNSPTIFGVQSYFESTGRSYLMRDVGLFDQDVIVSELEQDLKHAASDREKKLILRHLLTAATDLGNPRWRMGRDEDELPGLLSNLKNFLLKDDLVNFSYDESPAILQERQKQFLGIENILRGNAIKDEAMDEVMYFLNDQIWACDFFLKAAEQSSSLSAVGRTKLWHSRRENLRLLRTYVLDSLRKWLTAHYPNG